MQPTTWGDQSSRVDLPQSQQLAPLGSLTLSALVGLLPLVAIFVTLGVLRWKAHWAGLASLGVAVVVAVLAFGMPVGLALLSATEGAWFGLFPIMWIVFAAIWLYQLTVVSGRFEDLRAAFGLISDDPRVQAMSAVDPKILVALVCWAVYSFALFARRGMGWTGRRAAWLSALGFVIVLLNFVPVGYFLTKSHNF